jgi:SAM-dependent methyltransferase
VTAIDDCLGGTISPQVAVARMLLAGADAHAILAALDRSGPAPAVDAMRGLVRDRAAQLDALAAEVAATAAGHDASGATPTEEVARIAAFFDRAVQHSPEASVALYSLGDPAILAAATREIVDWLAAERLLPADADVLDLGCGIGRVAAALAGRCRSVLALDVSPGMVEEAGRRLAALPNVAVRRTGGEDLDWLEPAAFDLVLAIDSFPYIVQTGAATALRHAEGAARALRPGGALCILNLSYRSDLEADRADVAGWARATGMRVRHDGGRPFRLWDATAFVLGR